MWRRNYLMGPGNAMQAILPNWYNMSYRRSGAYKGMGLGQDLPLCTTITKPAGFVGPVACDPSQGGVNYVPSTSQFMDAVSSIQSQLDALTAGAGTSPTTTNWLPWVIGGGVLLLLLATGRR